MSDLNAYRASARAFLESMDAKYGRDARVGNTVEQDLALGREYMAAKHDAGFAGINLPVDMGVQGLTHLLDLVDGILPGLHQALEHGDGLRLGQGPLGPQALGHRHVLVGRQSHAEHLRTRRVPGQHGGLQIGLQANEHGHLQR